MWGDQVRPRSTWEQTKRAQRKVFNLIAEANLSQSDLTLKDIAATTGLTYDVVAQKVGNLLLRGKVARQCRYRVVT